MDCQSCSQALAEWKVREYLGADRNRVIRWWYLCDVCLKEAFGPWIGKQIPPLDDGQLWSSAAGGKIFQRKVAASAAATSAPT